MDSSSYSEQGSHFPVWLFGTFYNYRLFNLLVLIYDLWLVVPLKKCEINRCRGSNGMQFSYTFSLRNLVEFKSTSEPGTWKIVCVTRLNVCRWEGPLAEGKLFMTVTGRWIPGTDSPGALPQYLLTSFTLVSFSY